MATIGTEDMTCTLCRDIFTDPRFLIGCYHTFCMVCIQKHASAQISDKFPCPICREETTLPEDGVEALQENFYFKKETLAEARKSTDRNCAFHDDQEIDRVCLKCKTPACPNCIDHIGPKHRLQLLPTAEEAMKAQVQEVEDFLAINTKELQNLQSRTDALSRQLRKQRQILHAIVDQQFRMNNRDLWQICQKESEKLSKEITHLQQERNRSKNLHRLSRLSMLDPSIVNLVDVAQRVQCRLDQGVGLPPVKVSTCSVTFPGLACNTQTEAVEEALSQFLGCPTQHAPQTGPMLPPTKVIVVPIKLCRSKEVREILSVVPSKDGQQVVISFRGDPPHLTTSVATVQVEDGTVLNADHDVVTGKGVCVYDYREAHNAPFMVKMSYYGVFQVSKTAPSVCLLRDQFGTIRLHHLGVSQHSLGVTRYVPLHEAWAETLLQYLNIVDPINFDVSPKRKYYVIVDRAEDASKVSRVPRKRKLEDDESNGSSKKKKKKKAKKMKWTGENEEDGEILASREYHSQHVMRQPPFGAVVKLFRKGQRQPVDIYRPTNPSFLPSDVCFCHFGKKNVLLIADWQNDEVHVVRVKKNGFHFKRLMAERHGELAKPSALNTDTSGGIWVGCSNGSLLRCTM